MKIKKILFPLLVVISCSSTQAQLYTYKVADTSGKFGVYEFMDGRHQRLLVPYIFDYLSEFRGGLSLAVRSVPLISVSQDRTDTIFWVKYYPDQFLKGFEIRQDTTNGLLFVKGKDTRIYSYRTMTPEMMSYPMADDYMDSMGNYFLNVFPGFQRLIADSPFLYYQTTAIWMYGLIDTAGNIVQPLVYSRISFPEPADGQQNIFSFVYKNKTGFMDSCGRIMIPAKYDDPQNAGWIHHNETDQVMSYHFVNNLSEVSLDHKLGIIDTAGRVIIPFRYRQISYEWEYVNYQSTGNISKIRAMDFDDKVTVFDVKGRWLKE